MTPTSRRALVGAVCGIRTLGSPPGFDVWEPLQATAPLTQALPPVLIELVRGWLPLWLPLIGSALLLRGARGLLPSLRP